MEQLFIGIATARCEPPTTGISASSSLPAPASRTTQPGVGKHIHNGDCTIRGRVKLGAPFLGEVWLSDALGSLHSLLNRIVEEYVDFGDDDVIPAATPDDALKQLCMTCTVHPDRLACSLAVPVVLSQTAGSGGYRSDTVASVDIDSWGTGNIFADRMDLHHAADPGRASDSAAILEMSRDCQLATDPFLRQVSPARRPGAESLLAGSLLAFRCLKAAAGVTHDGCTGPGSQSATECKPGHTRAALATSLVLGRLKYAVQHVALSALCRYLSSTRLGTGTTAETSSKG